MSEAKTDIKDTVYPILLEELVGKDEWESFLGKAQEGKFEDADAMARYLQKAVVKRYGKLLPEERLDSHDEKIIAVIKQLLGVEKEYGKEKAAHKETKGLLRRLQSHLNFLEAEIVIEIAKVVGYDKEPVFVADKRQTLQHDYIIGLLEYIKTNSAQPKQVGESNKLLIEQSKENKELSDKVTALTGENAALKSEHDELKAKYEKLLAEKEELGLKFQKYHDIVEAFKSDIKPEVEKAEQNNKEE